MPLSVSEYAGRTRDSKWERNLARELRALTERERLEFLNALLDSHFLVAQDLARRCLSENQSFWEWLDRGLTEANPSSIRYWLECVVPRLGVRNVVAYLHKQSEANRKGVAFARYWLSLFRDLPGYDPAEVERLPESGTLLA